MKTSIAVVALSTVLCCSIVPMCLTLPEPAQQALTVVPINTAVTSGSTTTFFCASDVNLLIWTFQRVGSDTVDLIFNGLTISPEFDGIYAVDSSTPGQANLIIISANAGETGVYLCKETAGDEVQSANLVILDSEPICTVNITEEGVTEGASVVMRCTVTYTTNLSPMMMQWFDPSEQSVLSNDSIRPGRTESLITITSSPPVVGNYVCRVNFSEPTDAVTTAQNAPEYSYNYTSPTFLVFHCPTSVTIAVPDGDLFVGNTLSCSSNGYPAADFEWTCIETGEVTSGATVTLTRAGPFTYVCKATVTLNDVPCEFSETVNVTIQGRSCLHMKQENPNTPSGRYSISLASGKVIDVFCEMGLDGGGYTFLNPASLLIMTDDDVQELFTNRTQLLMRTRNTDTSQPYAVLQQLPLYSSIPIKIGLSTVDGYQSPLNAANIYQGSPYLYFGFLPDSVAGTVTTWGLLVNNVSHSYTKVITNLRNYIALFPGFSEVNWVNVGTVTYAFCTRFFVTNIKQNPSARVMPSDYFMFVEVYWAGTSTDGCVTNSNSPNMNAMNIRSVAIGFK